MEGVQAKNLSVPKDKMVAETVTTKEGPGSTHRKRTIPAWAKRALIHPLGNKVKFLSKICTVTNLVTDEVVLVAKRYKNIYVADFESLQSGDLNCLKAVDDDAELWHRRLGHAKSVHVIFDESHPSFEKNAEKDQDGEPLLVPSEVINMTNGKAYMMSQVKETNEDNAASSLTELSTSITTTEAEERVVDVVQGTPLASEKRIKENQSNLPSSSQNEPRTSNWRHQRFAIAKSVSMVIVSNSSQLRRVTGPIVITFAKKSSQFRSASWAGDLRKCEVYRHKCDVYSSHNCEQCSHLRGEKGRPTFAFAKPRPHLRTYHCKCDNCACVITKFCSERIGKYAFEYAYLNNRKKATAVASKYPGIKYNEIIVDNCCMQLVSKPERAI
uniref:Uncharacterized protein LOC104245660 n=1 Tax=Nicotiana sylvestris TaxID=4096 RepID=A0A1U7YCB9_NICSY|nr:PREDICTED: uncharacterized protein LOC104245660 [Nicotiana sylvestris]